MSKIPPKSAEDFLSGSPPLNPDSSSLSISLSNPEGGRASETPSYFGSKFKGISGAYLTKQLFWETSEDKSRVLYSLRDYDNHGYPSLRRLYVDMGDETEYQFAETYFGGWNHWKRLLSAPWFLDFISQYREELAAKNAAERLIAIRKKAQEGDFHANKYLLEGQWKGEKKNSVGRPTKERIREEAELLRKTDKTIDDDYHRLGVSDLVSSIGVME